MGGSGLGQVLAVVSGKGGTGKTSLCAAIACALAQEGQSVLLMDLDLGLRNLDLSLGLGEEPAIPFTAVMRGEYLPGHGPPPLPRPLLPHGACHRSAGVRGHGPVRRLSPRGPRRL